MSKTAKRNRIFTTSLSNKTLKEVRVKKSVTIFLWRGFNPCCSRKGCTGHSDLDLGKRSQKGAWVWSRPFWNELLVSRCVKDLDPESKHRERRKYSGLGGSIQQEDKQGAFYSLDIGE